MQTVGGWGGYYIMMYRVRYGNGQNGLLECTFFFFNSVLRPFQDYFSSYKTGQSAGGAKTPANRTWLVSHVASAGLEPTPDSGEMIE